MEFPTSILGLTSDAYFLCNKGVWRYSVKRVCAILCRTRFLKKVILFNSYLMSTEQSILLGPAMPVDVELPGGEDSGQLRERGK
jgi:hypothetical protein